MRIAMIAAMTTTYTSTPIPSQRSVARSVSGFTGPPPGARRVSRCAACRAGDAPGDTRGVASAAGDDDQVRWVGPRRRTEDRSLGSLGHAARDGDRLLGDRLDATGAQGTTHRIAQADAVVVVVIEHGRGAGP